VSAAIRGPGHRDGVSLDDSSPHVVEDAVHDFADHALEITARTWRADRRIGVRGDLDADVQQIDATERVAEPASGVAEHRVPVRK
jgi:hypothetical protein